MAANPFSSAYKKRLSALMSNSDSRVAINRILAKLANHEAVIRMLAQAFPESRESEIRQSLADGAAFFHDLQRDVLAAEAKPAAAAGEQGSGASNSGGKSAIKSLPAPEGSPAALRQADKVKVNIDGGSKGNPGPAAIGMVFTDLEGNTLFEQGLRIGEATNNVAEYTALITALKILLENGVREAYFFSDSELLVRQVTGVYKIKNPGLMPLAAEAQALRRKLARFQIVHVPREQNRRADQLANLAYQNS